MDDQTLHVYELRAKELAERDASIPSPLLKYFRIAFKPGARVLDVGAATGREVAGLLSDGFEAYGIEPSSALRAQAQVGLQPRLSAGALPALEVDEPFDGLVCSAVLQHLPRAELFEAALSLRNALKVGGRALVSLPRGPRPDVDESGRDAWGRLFNGVTVEAMQLLLERVGFLSVARWDEEDALRRPGIGWSTLLLERGAAAGARPIDQLATVIGTQERKVATYKLALLRALNDVAMTQAHRARWREDGRVAVPIEAIAERWVRYYWPLFAAPEFLPQMHGEFTAQRHLVGFAPQLHALMSAYRNRQGLNGFEADLATGLAAKEKALHAALMTKLKSVIKAGPVTYAGGALATGRLFGWEDGQVLVPGGLWRELSLLGHWVGDSLVLRWAEVIERLSDHACTPAKSLPALLPRLQQARDTSTARAIFAKPDGVECVWSGRRVHEQHLAIDHVIPWSLWHNNELWNLIPSHHRINAEKSDLLPSLGLLKRRKGALLDAWGCSLEARPEQFRREAAGQLGHAASTGGQWLPDLFEVLLESVETTRLQRGLESWEPRAA